MPANAPVEIGLIESLYRYPVKSMAGERIETAELGWHGVDGDRRLAVHQTGSRSDFPWLTASKLAELLLFVPHGRDAAGLPTHVRTPDGTELPILSEELDAEITRRHKAPVRMMQMKHGIFDDGSVSLIGVDTVGEVCRLAGQPADPRRFRPNIIVSLLRPGPFQEDQWLDRLVSFGEEDDAPAIAVTMRDARCSMINLDPESAASSPDMLKAAVRANENNAGVYGTVIRTGRLAVGQPIFLRGVTE